MLPDKAAALHYFLNRNHPYVDGNKRFAVTATDVFLYVNDAALMATDDEVTAFTLGVAAGEIDLAGCVVFLRERTMRQDWSDARFREWLTRIPEDAWPSVDAAWDEEGVPRRLQRIYGGVRGLLANLND